jgi:L-seryl-tRNA(Ser) seleniumtransferase
VEVGTTNRTRLGDYERVLPTVEALLKVHPSNYRVEGFAEATGYRDLATLATRSGIPFIADVGSGLLDTRTPWLAGAPPAWLADEPGVRQTLEAGAGVVLFSGDKLLGGPQAGVIVGRCELVEKMAAHPLMRAMRLDGPTLAALTVTFELYGADRGGDIPFWRMASLDAASLGARIDHVITASGVTGDVVTGESLPGAGSVPGETIPTTLLAVIDRPARRWRRLLDADPPILARLAADALLIDLRTVLPEDDAHIAGALAAS